MRPVGTPAAFAKAVTPTNTNSPEKISRKIWRLAMPKTSTSWKPGQTGNPNGRPKGSRDMVKEAFLKDLAEDWQENGLEALQKAREERPAEYCRMVAGLLPRDTNLNVEGSADAAFVALLDKLNESDRHTGKENARLKAENAALKGETPEDEPETTTDPPAVH